jgi:hypothetical protein
MEAMKGRRQQGAREGSEMGSRTRKRVYNIAWYAVGDKWRLARLRRDLR